MEPPWFPQELVGHPYYFKHGIWEAIHAILDRMVDSAPLFSPPSSVNFSSTQTKYTENLLCQLDPFKVIFLKPTQKYPANLKYPDNLGCHSCVIVAEGTRYE